MILTGPQIVREHSAGRLVISPFDPKGVEQNSYGFRLAPDILIPEDRLDCRRRQSHRVTSIPSEGIILKPGFLYLGSTLECMGSDNFAATLYASRSVSSLGIWIQVSAPLGHSGAIINWTLEFTVAHPVIVYAGMRIGKIAFWRPQGFVTPYRGKYTGSNVAVASKLSSEVPALQLRSSASSEGSP